MKLKKDLGNIRNRTKGIRKASKTDLFLSKPNLSPIISLKIQERIKYGVITEKIVSKLNNSLNPKVAISLFPTLCETKNEKKK